MAAFGISLFPAVICGLWGASEATLAFIALAAFIVSAFNLVELRKQRRDSQKPLLSPQDLGTYIMPIHQKQSARGTDGNLVRKKGEHLCIKNIGSGPAVNISIYVGELTTYKAKSACSKTIVYVPPLGKGDEDFVFHHSGSKSFIIKVDEWLVIDYDDIFGSHFRTQCQWSGEVWHNFKTETVHK